jgi:hypothetical protein
MKGDILLLPPYAICHIAWTRKILTCYYKASLFYTNVFIYLFVYSILFNLFSVTLCIMLSDKENCNYGLE